MDGHTARLLCVMMTAAFSSKVALGQVFVPPASGSGTVTGTGVVTLEKQANVMRLRVDVMAKVENLTTALVKLNEQKAAAKIKLIALKAKEGSVRFGPAQVTSGLSSQQEQMQRMVMQGLRSRGRAGQQKDKPVTISARLDAQWELPPDDADARLAMIEALQKRIKAADLAGAKALAVLTPEEEELMEEMQEMTYYGGQEEPSPGEPVFLFVAPITEEEKAKALAEAFQKAKVQAAHLAAAAGVQLGALRGLSGGVTADYSSVRSYNYGSAFYNMMQEMGADTQGDIQEAVAMDPASVKVRITVSAAFTIEGGR